METGGMKRKLKLALVGILVMMIIILVAMIGLSYVFNLRGTIFYDPTREVPSGYYHNVVHRVPHWTQLDDLLTNMPIPNYYKKGVFDCSERSAYVEWYLENHGVYARIVVGFAQPFLGEGGNHAWVEAYTTEGWVMIETSERGLFGGVYVHRYGSLLTTYQPMHIFNDIYDAVRYYGSIDEWDWWNVVT